MALEIATRTVPFDNVTHTDEPRTSDTGPIDFGRPVRQAWAFLSGFDIEFTNGEHPMRRVICNVFPEVAGTAVDAIVTLGWRDDSGSWDDPYQGSVLVTVIADVV